jgi:hypothetical protein
MNETLTSFFLFKTLHRPILLIMLQIMDNTCPMVAVEYIQFCFAGKGKGVHHEGIWERGSTASLLTSSVDLGV